MESQVFRNYIKLPLIDDGLSIFADSGLGRKMKIFDWLKKISPENKKELVDKINGKKIGRNFKGEFRKKGLEIYFGDLNILRVRGWGILTGVGGYKLDHSEASAIQDSFMDFVVDTLNKKEKEI